MKGVAGPITTDVVLVGGGHAHVHVMRAFGMRPERGVRVTLVAKELATPYSGMLPGVIAGLYRPHEMTIDLARLARATGTRLIHAAAAGLDRANRRVLLEGRPPIAYDVVSFDIGIAPRLDGIAGVERGLAVKPIATFLERFEAFLAKALKPGGPRNVVVAGAGAAGVELVLSIAARLRRDAGAAGCDPRRFRFTLLAGGGLLPGYPRAVQDLFFDALLKADVAFRDTAVLACIEDDAVVLADGRRFESDAVFVATSAAPHAITPALGLPLDAGGFIAVEPTLASPADISVFAVGDCSGVALHRSPKAGVFAVRQGPPLAANLRRASRRNTLKPFKPKNKYLSLIGRGDGTAVAARGGYAVGGRWAWALKDRIDRRWMAMYRDPPAMDGSHGPAPASDDPAMRCGGCTAKAGPQPLARALARLGPGIVGPWIVLGIGDDAVAIVRPDGGLDLYTVDLFKTFVDDPYRFGEIAAVHALGDVFAIGGRPRYALAMATLPPGPPAKQEETLFQLMAGARGVLDPLGVSILGGHSGDGAELAFGFAVAGGVEAGDALTKRVLLVGDALILTKALGTGILIAADMRAQASGAALEAAFASMRRPVGADAAVLAGHGARAATDVTGFGLAGHLGEMLTATGVAAELDVAALPMLPGVAALAAQGFTSRGWPATPSGLARIADSQSMPQWLKAVLFDPQTAGGLLAGVPADRAEPCVAALRAAGASDACVIGRVVLRDGPADVALSRRRP